MTNYLEWEFWNFLEWIFNNFKKLGIFVFFALVIALILFGFLSTYVSALDFVLASGESASKNITLIPAELIRLSVISPFNFSLSQTNFDNLQQATNIQITLSINKYVPAGVYQNSRLVIFKNQPVQQNVSYPYFNFTTNVTETRQMVVNVSNYSIEYTPLDILVLGKENFSVSSPTINCSTGDTGLFYVNITNEGNLNLILQISTQSGVLIIPNSTIVIPVGFAYQMPMFYRIPTQSNSLNLSEKFYVGTKEQWVIFFLVDKTSPTINYTIESENATFRYGDKFIVCYDISDNIGIGYTNLSFLGSVRALKEKGCESFVLNATDDNILLFISSDTNDNVRTSSKNISIEKIKNVIISPYMKFNQVRPSRETTTFLLSTEKAIDVDITITSLNVQGMNVTIGNESSAVRMRLIDDDRTTILNMSGGVVHATIHGNGKLAIYSDYLGDITGTVTLTFPNYVDVDYLIKKIDFAAKFGEYDVSPPWQGSIFSLATTCNPLDSGQKENSSYRCCLDYPIDSKVSDMAIPCSQTIQKSIDERWTVENSYLKADIGNLNAWRLWLITFIVLLIIIILFLIFFKGKVAVVRPDLGG